jgi:uncharacterized protein YecE (DUF72 family)
MKKLKEPKQPLRTLLSRLDGLGDKLGPILFQLPPRWKVNPGRLESFLELLPADYRCTFEFRDPSWWRDDILEALAGKNAAFCIFNLAGRTSPREITADFVYLRLHGPEDAYEGRYGKRKLSGWAGAVNAWLDAGRDVYCYFDNDQNGYAPQDALALQELLMK